MEPPNVYVMAVLATKEERQLSQESMGNPSGGRERISDHRPPAKRGERVARAGSVVKAKIEGGAASSGQKRGRAKGQGDTRGYDDDDEVEKEEEKQDQEQDEDEDQEEVTQYSGSAKRIRRWKLAFEWMQLQTRISAHSPMWFMAQLGITYTLGRLAIDDARTDLVRRDIDNFLSAQDCINMLRFSREQIILLLDYLSVPEWIRTDCGFVVSGREAICVLLYRLASPCRYDDMRLVFGLSNSCICETFNYMVHFLDHNWGFLLSMDITCIAPRLQEFADAIHLSGAPLANCWGFVDGTVHSVARPKRGQRALYNGHKKKHALKFQGVVTPDGIFVDLWGPLDGSHDNVHMLFDSNLVDYLMANCNNAAGDSYCLYGNPAYGLSTHLCCPFRTALYGPLTPEMSEFNKRMSHCRVAVEWGFKENSRKWTFLSLKTQQKTLLSPVGVHFRVTTLLSNFHSCLNGGNEISQFFHVAPPSLSEYLRLHL